MTRERVLVAKCSRGRLSFHFSGGRKKTGSGSRKYYYSKKGAGSRTKPRPRLGYSNDDYYKNEINKNYTDKQMIWDNGVAKYHVYGAFRTKAAALKWIKQLDAKMEKDPSSRQHLQYVKDDLLGRIGKPKYPQGRLNSNRLTTNLITSSFHHI